MSLFLVKNNFKIGRYQWHFFNFNVVLVLACIFLLNQCYPRSKNMIIKPIKRTMASIDTLSKSSIEFPISVSLKVLEEALNKVVGKELYTSSEEDKYMMRAEKSGDIKFNFDGDYFYYDVPVRIEVAKSTFVGRFSGDGEILLKFRTSMDFDTSWAVKTYTDLLDYNWIVSPRVNVLPGLISLDNIASYFVESSKKDIAAEIDKSLVSAFNLKAMGQTIWDNLQVFRKLSEEYEVYTVFSPDSIQISPLTNIDENLSFTLQLSGFPFLLLEEDTALVSKKELPSLGLDCKDNKGIDLHIQAQMDYKQMSILANQFLIGEVFKNRGKEVKIERINMYPKDSLLVFDVLLSGDFTGSIYLEGSPYYDVQKAELSMKNVHFDGDTKNFLQKSFIWLLKNTFRKKIEDKLIFPVGEKIGTLKNEINDKIVDYRMTDGILINAEIDNFEFDKIFLLENDLICRLKLNGAASLKIDNFDLMSLEK